MIWNKIPYNIKDHLDTIIFSDYNHTAFKKFNINTSLFNKELNEYEKYMITNPFQLH